MYRYILVSLLLVCFANSCMGQEKTEPAPPKPSAVSQDNLPKAQLDLQNRCERKIDPRWSGYCAQVAGIAFQHATGRFLQLPGDTVYTIAVANDIREEAFLGQLLQYQAQRLDKQTGSNTSAGGSTSLVSKPGIPDLLAFAVEAGALTQSNNGTSTTFQGNVGSLIGLLGGISPVCIRLVSCSPIPWLGSIAVSATTSIEQSGVSTTAINGSGNTNLPAGSMVSTPASRTRLSSFSVRYEISNRFDPHSGVFRDKFEEAVRNDARLKAVREGLVTSFNSIAGLEATHEELAKLGTIYQAKSDVCMKASADEDALDCLVPVAENFGRDYVDVLRRNNQDDFDKAVSAYYGAITQLQSIRDTAYESAKGTPMFTADYLFNRPPQQPDTHDLRLVFGKALGAGLLSANAAVSIYGGTIPTSAGVGRFRDAQVAGQFDRPLSKSKTDTSAVLSLAGYYQYQPKPSVLNISSSNLAPGTNIVLPQDAQVLLGPSGSIWVSQVKLTIKLKNGAEIPIAGKWSNKPDLLSGNKWGGQFGLTYDLSAFKQLLGR